MPFPAGIHYRCCPHQVLACLSTTIPTFRMTRYDTRHIPLLNQQAAGPSAPQRVCNYQTLVTMPTPLSSPPKSRLTPLPYPTISHCNHSLPYLVGFPSSTALYHYRWSGRREWNERRDSPGRWELLSTGRINTRQRGGDASLDAQELVNRKQEYVDVESKKRAFSPKAGYTRSLSTAA